MFQLMETTDDSFFNYTSYIYGISSYQRLINEKKIRETFHMIDVNGNGELDLAELRPILEEEYQAGESGASISQDAQVWVHIMEELERDGIRPVSYNEFYDAILVVI